MSTALNRSKKFDYKAIAAALTLLASSTVAMASGHRHELPSWCATKCDQVVVDWNQHAFQVIKLGDGYQNPMDAARVVSIMHLAMHDAVNAVAPHYRSFAYQGDGQPVKADAVVAAAAAAHRVMTRLYPKQAELSNVILEVTLNDAGPGPEVVEGKRIGIAAADAVLAKRSQDGSQGSEEYKPGTKPGEYRFTPGFEFLGAPHWRRVTPFTMTAPEQFRVTPPPSLTSAAYTKDFNEVKATGSKAADAKRSAEQTQYAAYWYEFSEAGWNRIARNVARGKAESLWERARTFALLNSVMSDAYVAGWDSKMHYNLWRPVTAVRLAAEDGNPQTAADANWEPMLPTPPVQDYPSTHSALGAAAAAVLSSAYGRQTGFEMASPTALPGYPSRKFKSFAQAADENGDSRVRAGLHFRFAVTHGLGLGEKIGQQALSQFLKPLR
jgi:hypothetical protein